MILLIDNYDSFVYNLYQLIGSVSEDIKVVRNDEVTIEQIKELKPSHIILSPGPGRPSEAGIIEEVIKEFYQTVPILGVCLGHQAIIETFGGEVGYAKKVMHGKASEIVINNSKNIFKNVGKVIRVSRYHSLAGKDGTLPDCLEVIGYSDDKEIMAIKVKKHPVYGLQFHPESILSEDGQKMISNFLKEKRND